MELPSLTVKSNVDDVVPKLQRRHNIEIQLGRAEHHRDVSQRNWSCCVCQHKQFIRTHLKTKVWILIYITEIYNKIQKFTNFTLKTNQLCHRASPTSARATMAPFLPAAPMTPPPGCAPAPTRYNPFKGDR